MPGDLVPREWLLTRVASEQDPATQASVATSVLAELADTAAAVKQVRRDAVLSLLNAGWTYQQVADHLGVNRARAFQIARGQSGTTARYYA